MLFYSTPCQSISAAGLQHGFTEGSGTRSSIIWNVRDALKTKRPKYACLENVKAMVSKKFMPMFNLWQSELVDQGYTNFPQVLNAKDYGVPQNRERIFLVSILGEDARFSFPAKMPLEIRLKDVLQPPEEVDEKYYLSDKMLEYFKRVNDDHSHGHDFKPSSGGGSAFAIRTMPGNRVDDNFIKEE
jgi:DNA (cytosine-5)-methyltransferase 1